MILIRPTSFYSRYPLSIQLAAESWMADGPRTREHLVELVGLYGRQYGLGKDQIVGNIERALKLLRED